MGKSLELKSTIFNIDIQPTQVVSDSINTIKDKMNQIKSSVELNQIAFIESTL